MNWKNRILRIALALGIATAIAMQIPSRGGAAIAQDTYGGGGGGGARTLIQATVFALVGYGIYATATGGSVAAPNPVPGADPTNNGTTPPPPSTGDPIWDVSNNDNNLNTFAKASDSAGLKETLRRPGKYTAFIPTNNAFGALDQQVLTDLLKEENKAKLADIIGFHVVEGAYTVEQLKAEAAKAGTEGLKLTTITMKTLVITNDGGLKVNGTPVVETDVPASNGLIHPVSAVLMPPSE